MHTAWTPWEKLSAASSLKMDGWSHWSLFSSGLVNIIFPIQWYWERWLHLPVCFCSHFCNRCPRFSFPLLCSNDIEYDLNSTHGYFGVSLEKMPLEVIIFSQEQWLILSYAARTKYSNLGIMITFTLRKYKKSLEAEDPIALLHPSPYVLSPLKWIVKL